MIATQNGEMYPQVFLQVQNLVWLLGLVMSSTLQWNDNIKTSIKKANKCLYFIVLLKREGVNFEDVIEFLLYSDQAYV